MDAKEMKVLDKCMGRFLDCYEPSTKLLELLRVKKILTEENLEKIQKRPTREAKVADLLDCVRRGGPKAFNAFKDQIRQEKSWLADEMDKELEPIEKNDHHPTDGHNMKEIVEILVPLVYTPDKTKRLKYLSRFDRLPTNQKLQNIKELTLSLKTWCHNVLKKNTDHPVHDLPLHILIEQTVQDKRCLEEAIRDLRSENEQLNKAIKDLKKSQVKPEKLSKQNNTQNTVKLRKEVNKLKLTLERVENEKAQLKMEKSNLLAEIESMRYNR